MSSSENEVTPSRDIVTHRDVDTRDSDGTADTVHRSYPEPSLKTLRAAFNVPQNRQRLLKNICDMTSLGNSQSGRYFQSIKYSLLSDTARLIDDGWDIIESLYDLEEVFKTDEARSTEEVDKILERCRPTLHIIRRYPHLTRMTDISIDALKFLQQEEFESTGVPTEMERTHRQAETDCVESVIQRFKEIGSRAGLVAGVSLLGVGIALLSSRGREGSSTIGQQDL